MGRTEPGSFVSSQEKSWFHCGRCGALFESDPGDMPDRRCGKCGFDPSLLSRTSVPPPPEPEPTEEKQQPTEQESEPKRSSRRNRKRKNRHLMLKLVFGWIVLLALIVGGVHFLWGDRNQRSASAPPSTSGSPSLSEENKAQLSAAEAPCRQVLNGFLSAAGPEQQNQFVLRPVETIGMMTRFYSLNPMPKIEASALELTSKTFFRIADTPTVELLFKTSEGEQIDVAFQMVEEDRWLIDWPAYVRFGDYPLPLFLAGAGPDEAEFRLLVRERLARERKDEETMSLVFCAPRFGRPKDTGTPSPEFLVPRDSDDGRMLAAGFAAAEAGERPFGSILDLSGPDDMIRVRVRLRRNDEDEERRFEIVRVIACHWYSTDEPGLDLTEPPPPADEKTDD